MDKRAGDRADRASPIGGGSNEREKGREWEGREGAISQLISGAINDAIEVRDNRRRGRGIEGGLDGTWMGWDGRREGQTTIF